MIVINIFRYVRNKYYLNEKNLLINEQNLNEKFFKIFKKYIDKHTYLNVYGIRVSLKIKNLKRYNLLLEDTSLDIPRYIYLFNKIVFSVELNYQ